MEQFINGFQFVPIISDHDCTFICADRCVKFQRPKVLENQQHMLAHAKA